MVVIWVGIGQFIHVSEFKFLNMSDNVRCTLSIVKLFRWTDGSIINRYSNF